MESVGEALGQKEVMGEGETVAQALGEPEAEEEFEEMSVLVRVKVLWGEKEADPETLGQWETVTLVDWEGLPVPVKERLGVGDVVWLPHAVEEGVAPQLSVELTLVLRVPLPVYAEEDEGEMDTLGDGEVEVE